MAVQIAGATQTENLEDGFQELKQGGSTQLHGNPSPFPRGFFLRSTVYCQGNGEIPLTTGFEVLSFLDTFSNKVVGMGFVWFLAGFFLGKCAAIFWVDAATLRHTYLLRSSSSCKPRVLNVAVTQASSLRHFTEVSCELSEAVNRMQWAMVAMQDQQENETGGHGYWLKLEFYGAVTKVASVMRIMPG